MDNGKGQNIQYDVIFHYLGTIYFKDKEGFHFSLHDKNNKKKEKLLYNLNEISKPYS